MSILITGEALGTEPVSVCGYTFELKEFNVIAKSRWMRFASDEKLLDANNRVAELSDRVNQLIDDSTNPARLAPRKNYDAKLAKHNARWTYFDEHPDEYTDEVADELLAEADTLEALRLDLRTKSAGYTEDVKIKLKSMQEEITTTTDAVKRAKVRFLLSMVMLKEDETPESLAAAATPNELAAADLVILTGNAATSDSSEENPNRAARRAKN